MSAGDVILVAKLCVESHVANTYIPHILVVCDLGKEVEVTYRKKSIRVSTGHRLIDLWCGFDHKITKEHHKVERLSGGCACSNSFCLGGLETCVNGHCCWTQPRSF